MSRIRLTADQLAVVNKLEPHLGCFQCRGPLTNGRCPKCQGSKPSAKESGFVVPPDTSQEDEK